MAANMKVNLKKIVILIPFLANTNKCITGMLVLNTILSCEQVGTATVQFLVNKSNRPHFILLSCLCLFHDKLEPKILFP